MALPVLAMRSHGTRSKTGWDVERAEPITAVRIVDNRMRARDSDPTVADVAHGRHPASSPSGDRRVQWCGHLQELVLVPDGPDWFTETPVLGTST